MDNEQQQQVRSIAERIARRLLTEAAEPTTTADARQGATLKDQEIDNAPNQVVKLRGELADVRRRLERIEAQHQTSPGAREPQSETVQFGKSPAVSRRSEVVDQTREPNVSDQPNGNRAAVRSPWLSGVYVPAATAAVAGHPSAESFGVGEAVAELVDYFEQERICEIEPGGKPCDHCAMCSTRGF